MIPVGNFPRSSILFVHSFFKLIANHMTCSFLDIPKWIRISHPSYFRIWWVFGIIKRVSNGMITNVAIKNNTLVYCGQKCISYVSRVTRSVEVSHWVSQNSSRFHHWWISDLNPKKSEKLEFWKNFRSIFLSVKNWIRLKISSSKFSFSLKICHCQVWNFV